jgi:hypothetical protein
VIFHQATKLIKSVADKLPPRLEELPRPWSRSQREKDIQAEARRAAAGAAQSGGLSQREGGEVNELALFAQKQVGSSATPWNMTLKRVGISKGGQMTKEGMRSDALPLKLYTPLVPITHAAAVPTSPVLVGSAAGSTTTTTTTTALDDSSSSSDRTSVIGVRPSTTDGSYARNGTSLAVTADNPSPRPTEVSTTVSPSDATASPGSRECTEQPHPDKLHHADDRFRLYRPHSRLRDRRKDSARLVLLDAKFEKFTRRPSTSSALAIPLRNAEAPFEGTEEEYDTCRILATTAAELESRKTVRQYPGS